MRKQTQPTHAAARWLLACLVAFSLVATTGVIWTAATGHGAPSPWVWSPALTPDSQPGAAGRLDAVPNQPAETFTSRAFWIVLGLVVLSSLVLRADFPEPN
jgi:hypothetical protein